MKKKSSKSIEKSVELIMMQFEVAALHFEDFLSGCRTMLKGRDRFIYNAF